MESTHFAIAFLFGLIPCLFWVWFWLREDSRRPEPFFLLAISFIAGMAVVPLAFPIQGMAQDIYSNGHTILSFLGKLFPPLQNGFDVAISGNPIGTDLIIIWVIIEEVLKYAVVLVLIFWNREVDEPIDMVIYLIVIALGFAALENALFIFNPLNQGQYLGSVAVGSFRFMGPTLLHVLASGTIGVALALSYYQSKTIQIVAGTIGLCIAIVLHAVFNFFIMGTSGESVLFVFLFVWLGIIILFLLFEKIKSLELEHSSLTKIKN